MPGMMVKYDASVRSGTVVYDQSARSEEVKDNF